MVSVNVGVRRPTEHSTVGVTGIDKRPVDTPVEITVPARGSGLAGDAVCDRRYHGGPDQAVYAYAGEDLEHWRHELGRTLPPGTFGENLTTRGLDVTGALIGERWQVGPTCVLEVSAPRLPCRTFAAFLAEQGWVRRFTEQGRPGAYLRVIRPGSVCAGDPMLVLHRPAHDVTIGLAFRALTSDRAALPRLLAAEPALSATVRRRVRRRVAS